MSSLIKELIKLKFKVVYILSTSVNLEQLLGFILDSVYSEIFQTIFQMLLKECNKLVNCLSMNLPKVFTNN